MLTDDSGSFHLIDFVSRNSLKRINSVMGAEAYAIIKAFDSAYVIRKTIEKIYKKAIPVTMDIDSKQVFDSITIGTYTEAKRLMLDLFVTRDAYKILNLMNFV